MQAVTLALIALGVGLIPTLNIVVTWLTSRKVAAAASDASSVAAVAADHSLRNKAVLDNVQVQVNGQLQQLLADRDRLAAENARLKSAGVTVPGVEP
jgi:hypothetical protein